MQQALQLVSLAVIASLLVGVIKEKAFAAGMVLLLCVISAFALIEVCQPIIAFVREIQEQIPLEQALFTPLWKILGISLICRFGMLICADAGQKALSDLIKCGGSLLSIYASLPLMRAVLAVLKTLLGG